jgi:hypothetical protein
MPYKLFQDADILTHTDVNTYFMDQALVVFDTYNDMVAAYGGAGEAPNQEGRIAYAKDTQQIYVYTDSDGLGTLGWVSQVAQIGDGVISAIKLRQVSGSEAVVEDAIRDGAVTEDKIGTGAVTENKIGTGAVTSGKLGSNLTLAGTVTGNPAAGTTSTGTSGFGYMGLPQNATTTGSYTVLAADAGKHIYSTATRTITIPANATTAMPVGSTLVFIAGSGATVTIAITSDTLYLAGPGTTGSRTLAAFGMATAVKITATSWIISGNGLT